MTTPPQPASKARTMLLSDSVGGAEESRNGFGNLIPVNVVDRSTLMASSPQARMEAKRSAVCRGRKEGNRQGLDAVDIFVIFY
ncbi:MAG: hypothetical protein DMF81_09915 [Acidobacteria bacterium]|nr:MAG: hypothetical protein DMF81_09915 [Acidobacteriota bacterium]